MTKTITATYETPATLSNMVDDLVNDGLPREATYRDDEALQVKVMIPDAVLREVDSILRRHNPKEVH